MDSIVSLPTGKLLPSLSDAITQSGTWTPKSNANRPTTLALPTRSELGLAYLGSGNFTIAHQANFPAARLQVCLPTLGPTLPTWAPGMLSTINMKVVSATGGGR